MLKCQRKEGKRNSEVDARIAMLEKHHYSHDERRVERKSFDLRSEKHFFGGWV